MPHQSILKTSIKLVLTTFNFVLIFGLVILGTFAPTNNPINNPTVLAAATFCINSAGPSGAIYPACNKCPAGQIASGDLQTNGSCDPLPPGCGNGASNPPTCDICPSEMIMSAGSCTACDNGGCANRLCKNGSTNPPSCVNSCPAGTSYLVGSSCVNYEKAGISYQEFNPETKLWTANYVTPNGYNAFKCDDIKTTADPAHLYFDNQNYFGIKEICTKTIANATATGLANPKTYYYSFVYKQVNNRTAISKYYVYTYSSYYDANGNFVNWYSQEKKENPNSTGWIVYSSENKKI